MSVPSAVERTLVLLVVQTTWPTVSGGGVAAESEGAGTARPTKVKVAMAIAAVRTSDRRANARAGIGDIGFSYLSAESADGWE